MTPLERVTYEREERHYVACSLHGIAFCAICHRIPGQCGCGGCQNTATAHLGNYNEIGVLVEVRHVCASCADLPMMQKFPRLGKAGK